jgi:hypothetical protein
LLPFGTIVNFFLLPFIVLSFYPKTNRQKVTLGHEMRFPLFHRLRSAAKMNMFSFIRNFIGCPVSFCATRYTIVWHFSVPFTVCHFAEICCHSGSSVEQNDFMAAFSNRMKP